MKIDGVVVVKIPNVTDASDDFYNNNTSVPFSPDLLKHINESHDLRCLIKVHIDRLYNFEKPGCPVSFDTILCWPRTQPDSIATLSCLSQFQGVLYDESKNATRYCNANGVWSNYTNYNDCIHIAPSPTTDDPLLIEIPTIVYYVGYTLSLISLSLAVFVFIHFKDLRCLRNTIHANLFLTYIMSGLFWILTLSLQMELRPGAVGCIILVTLFHYFSLTNFFWMMVEGLYLYMLVVETFSGDNLRFNMYALIGWGGPAVFIISWAIAKGATTPTVPQAEVIEFSLDRAGTIEFACPWMKETTVDWIFQIPVCVMLIINLIFLIRIMWVLITKLRSANTVETKQYRKATKALLILIPLLGLTYLVVLMGPNEGVSGNIFNIIRAFLLSTQGLSVSLFYCFLNSEVRLALRHRIDRWRDERNIRLGQLHQRSQRYTQTGFSHSKDYSPRSRTESIRPLTHYGKRESCASSATTTTLLGPNSNYNFRSGSNGALHLSAMPRAISPLMQHGLDENYV